MTRVPRNYATRDGLELLFMAEAGPGRQPGDGTIELEANGQADMLACDVLPTRLGGATDEDLTELGFVLGDVVDDDPLFRYATIPPGWTRAPAEGLCGSYVVDEHGRRRLMIFYKAAPYDRKASCVLLPVDGPS
jgi:hypothetical protein